MDYDLQKETRVWERIQGAQARRCGGLSAEELRNLIRDEISDACAYRTLARLLPGRERDCLLRMAQDEARHAKRLETVFFLTEGRRFCPETPERLCAVCLTEALRERWKEELDAADRYTALAGRAAEFAPVFTGMAEDEARHARTVLRLLQKLL